MHTRKGIGGSNPSLSAKPIFAGVIQWQNRSFPSFLRGFDSHRPLHFFILGFVFMLKKLTVSNLAIVERAEVDFAAGLNVITGETGAGKSVLMGALDLVLGGRADSSVVRDGAKEAEVEAEFDDVVIRRTVTATGRTRAWVNDESVSIAELREMGRKMVDIHGPRANQFLLDERFQRTALDAFGGCGSVFARYASAYSDWSGLMARISELQSTSSVGLGDEMDMLRYQIDELAGAELTEEDEGIAERHAAASNMGEIVETTTTVTELLGGDGGAEDVLARVQSTLAALARRWPQAEEWAAQAEELTVRVQELSRSVADAVSRLDLGEDDLAELDRRLSIVNRLKRKYAQTQVSGLLELLERKRERLNDLETRDERIAALEREAESARKTAVAAAKELTRKRKTAAEKLGKAVTKELRDLGFLQAKFFVTLDPREIDATGADCVTYMLEPNPGESARPLSSIASSGEIARVMLALKSVLSEHDSVGLLVFDEIDANIGGETGRVVGEKMRGVARRHQVVAITHLPQSAVFGERHLVVAKSVSDGRTRTSVRAVEGKARVEEIARMLGGEMSSGVVRRHAEELLKVKG